jgi:hypothetical protein
MARATARTFLALGMAVFSWHLFEVYRTAHVGGAGMLWVTAPLATALLTVGAFLSFRDRDDGE